MVKPSILVAGDELVDYEQARLQLARMQVSGGGSLSEALGKITETSAEALRVERVGIWLYVHDRRAIRCYDLYESSRQEHSEGAILYAADFPVYFRALEERRVVPVSDVLNDPTCNELKDAYLGPLGIRALIDAPIFRAGQVIGVVCHENIAGPRQWLQEECDFVGSVADSIALKFESAARQDAELSRRAIEVHLTSLHRMDAMGRLAASAAHDFKNILTVVQACGTLMSRDAKMPAHLQDLVQQVLEASQRGNVLAEELMAFGRNQPRQTAVLNVAAVVAKMKPMLQTTIGSNHSVHLERTGNGRVLIDPSHLERVVLNLVLNARDAMAEGGTITIVIEDCRVANGIGEPGVYTVVEVTDAGVGMDPATRARLFEPFFTTKPKGKGTGLGLPIVHRIVERAGGFIHVASEKGKGTSVRVYLPRLSAEA